MKKLATLLEGLLENPKATQGKSLFDLQSSWAQFVEEELAKKSYPKELLDQGVLLIEILNSSAMQIFQLQKQALLQRLQNNFQQLCITQIRLKQVSHLTACSQRANGQEIRLSQKPTEARPISKQQRKEQTYRQFLKDLLK